MNAWKLYLIGTVVLVCAGIAFSLIGDKGFVLAWFAGRRHPFPDYFFYYVTLLGEPPGFIIIGVLLWLRSWRKMLIIPILGGLVTLISYILKNIFEHERPILYLKRIGWEGPLGVLDYYVNTGHASFPSGHSMAAWALFTLTAALIARPWVSILCLLLAASVSVSRVYLMVHFLQDVVAGAVVGFAIGYIFYFIAERYIKTNHQDVLLDEADQS